MTGPALFPFFVVTIATFDPVNIVNGVINASDIGYRSHASDSGGVVPYPPFLDSAFQINRALNIDPTQSSVAAAWGTLNLANSTGAFSALSRSTNCDGRAVNVYYGRKTLDGARNIEIDPAFSSLTKAFQGIATPWFLTDTQLQIPLRDATYWLENQPYQKLVYGGTGYYDGTAALAGTARPKTRGGTNGNPIRNITPVLVDPVNLVYDYNDAPGHVIAIYEGGNQSYTFAGDVADVYVGSTPSGQYRTADAIGKFQLGSTPSLAITADVRGNFPVAGSVSNVTDLIEWVLLEDMALPASYFDLTSLVNIGNSYTYTGGFYYGSSTTPVDGVTVVDALLTSIGAQMVPLRNGRLGFIALRTVSQGATPVAAFDTNTIVSCTPVALPSTLVPPPYRVRINFQHNYTVQTSGISPSATAAQFQFMQLPDNYAIWISAAIQNAYQRPNDFNPLPTVLLDETQATNLASVLGQLYSGYLRAFDIVLPLDVALQREIGDIVEMTYPLGDLSSGRIGQIIGDTMDSSSATGTLRVLVTE
jgi:hypothetical protein